MKDILLHMIDNEDWIVNWVIRNKSQEYKREKKSEDYLDMAQILSQLNEVEGKTRRYLAEANEIELKKRVNFVLRSGKVFISQLKKRSFNRSPNSFTIWARSSRCSGRRTSSLRRCSGSGTTREIRPRLEESYEEKEHPKSIYATVPSPARREEEVYEQ